MDFEEFREKLKEDLGERLFARTGDEFEITSSSVTKLQNAGYEGISVRKEPLCPAVQALSLPSSGVQVQEMSL